VSRLGARLAAARARTLTALTAAFLAATVALLATPASAVAAGWTHPQTVQSGTDPVLTFSPSGAAAVGSELTLRHQMVGVDIDLAPAGSAFATSPYTLTAPSAGHGPEPLAGLALSSTGYLAASFAAPGHPAPVLVRVAPPAPSNFATLQSLVPTGTAAAGQASADSLAMVATTRGELVGAGTDDAGGLHTATLGPGRTSFVTAPGLKRFSATDAYGLSADAAGNTFLAGDGPNGCTTVAFRPARASFQDTYATGNCATATPNIFDAITATSRGYAGLLTEDVSEAGLVPSRLLVQVGRDGHFGVATQLGTVLGGPVGLAADADGELTAEWTNCQAGPVSDGRLTTTDCAIDAATGSVVHGFSHAAAVGTPLVSAEPGTTLKARVADRGVAVSDCRASRCSLSAFTAEPGGGFRRGHRLATNGTLADFSGDLHGDLLAVWVDSHGRLFAATGSAASGDWSPAHLLSSRSVSSDAVTAAYGPHRRAIVAWSAGDRTYAASFTL
jgi:hypothetical protein